MAWSMAGLWQPLQDLLRSPGDLLVRNVLALVFYGRLMWLLSMQLSWVLASKRGRCTWMSRYLVCSRQIKVRNKLSWRLLEGILGLDVFNYFSSFFQKEWEMTFNRRNTSKIMKVKGKKKKNKRLIMKGQMSCTTKPKRSYYSWAQNKTQRFLAAKAKRETRWVTALIR